MPQKRKQPELLLAAAALLVAAGVLLVMGAMSRRDGPAVQAGADSGSAAVNPFEAEGHTEPPMVYAEPPTQSPELPTQPAMTEPKASAAPQAPQASYPVNINTADQAQLETLPGIGPAKAQAILEWRRFNGVFTDPRQLLEISGIGEATLAKLLPYIVV